MAKYPYFLLPSPQGSIPKPLISVILNHPKTHKITSGIQALIDSGSDITLCAKYIGDWLGINFKNKKPCIFYGVNNQPSESFKEIIKIHVCNKIYSCPIQFTDVLPRLNPIILGQKGFFDHFKVTFDLINNEMEII